VNAFRNFVEIILPRRGFREGVELLQFPWHHNKSKPGFLAMYISVWICLWPKKLSISSAVIKEAVIDLAEIEVRSPEL